ncbi:hypothetical protein [Actinocatenispora rupis]|uniref:Uncharacterized protein n=1 Tax=Actinocatenispora rupis TaxID=519421 RepID=A0A8J3JAP9_9ACTN|nr:hypothetical protein [Actinocatenispora rupis]GID14881.1 hypothetical protein Aru02nite_57700 [Actinocatenispora rupis]
MAQHRAHRASTRIAIGMWAALTAALAARIARLRAHPDQGAETAEIVVGIALAAGVAIAVWKFLGPELHRIASAALSAL